MAGRGNYAPFSKSQRPEKRSQYITEYHQQEKDTSADVLQLGLLSNFSSLNGVGINVMSSIVHQNAKGVQLSGFLNISGLNASGLQLAGFANLAGKNLNGMALAGLMNISGQSTHGVQVAGLGNITGKNLKRTGYRGIR